MVEDIEVVLESLNTGTSIEAEGIKFYSDAARLVEDNEGKAALSFLAREEEKHKKFLEEVKSSLKKSKTAELSKKLAKHGKIFERPKIFPEKEEYMKKVKAAQGDKKILEEAKEIERKSIKFYQETGNRVKNEEHKKVFTLLVNEEKKHLKWLEFLSDYMNVQEYWLGTESYFSLDG